MKRTVCIQPSVARLLHSRVGRASWPAIRPPGRTAFAIGRGLWAIGCLLALTAAPLFCATPSDTLRTRDRQIRQVLGERDQPRTPEQDARLRALVNGIFDYDTHTRESFGRYWSQLTERDRNEALRLVSTLLERSSMEKIHEYRTNAIQYVSERIDPANPEEALVMTRVIRDREKWLVGYKMRLAASQWRIIDVIIEDASTVENNRATFYKEIRASGIQGLLQKLRKKAEQR